MSDEGADGPPNREATLFAEKFKGTVTLSTASDVPTYLTTCRECGAAVMFSEADAEGDDNPLALHLRSHVTLFGLPLGSLL